MTHSHQTRPAARHTQRGAAILLAMLTVVLVATLASSMLWQQWRELEVESAQRTRVQSQWILTGALDWARLILREDARQGGSDNLTEPWAVPLAPARLSTFLAAQQGQTTVGDDDDPSQEAFLSGDIQDLQARLNVTNLIEDGQLHPPSLAAWSGLFKELKLPEAELSNFTDALLQATRAGSATPEQALVKSPNALRAALMPRRVDDLHWLGLSGTTLAVLEPYITLLPVRTVVNLNTAPLEVLVAIVPNLTAAQAQQLIQSRATQPFGTLMDALLVVTNPSLRFDPALHGVVSRYFGVTGRLRVGANTVQERSVLQRDGLVVTAISRQRGMVMPPGTTLQ